MKSEPTLESVKQYLIKRMDAATHSKVASYYHAGYITVVLKTHSVFQHDAFAKQYLANK